MDAYWNTIQQKFDQFASPGDDLRCIDVFSEPGRRCELCGYFPITWNHVLENSRTKQRLTVGRHCVHNIKVAANPFPKELRIVYPAEYEREANLINKRYPGTVLIVPFTDIDLLGSTTDQFEADVGQGYLDAVDTDPDDLAPDGMGGDEFDFEAFDYEVGE